MKCNVVMFRSNQEDHAIEQFKILLNSIQLSSLILINVDDLGTNYKRNNSCLSTFFIGRLISDFMGRGI